MKPLVLTMGEPSSVSGELTIAAWKQREALQLPVFFAIDNIERLRALDSDLPIQEINSPSEAQEVFKTALPVLSLELPEQVKLGQLNPANGQAVIDSIAKAVEYCMSGDTAGLVTNPIHKAALYDIGFKHPGHTEYVADLCGKSETPIMMLTGQDLKVVPLTVHIPLKDVPSAISEDLIIKKARIIDKALKQDFKIDAPRIAIAGLNPHAGEDGKMGKEDVLIITPAIDKLKAEGIQATGPHPADTLFHAEARSRYDIALGMYHDQALIPVKTLDFHGGVNVTLGLSVVRTSPDHGTALDIAGQGLANPTSFINAILMAREIAENRMKRSS